MVTILRAPENLDSVLSHSMEWNLGLKTFLAHIHISAVSYTLVMIGQRTSNSIKTFGGLGREPKQNIYVVLLHTHMTRRL